MPAEPVHLLIAMCFKGNEQDCRDAAAQCPVNAIKIDD